MKGFVWWTLRRPGRGGLTVAAALLACVPREGAVPGPPPGNRSECATPRPDWIWCDDFEQDRLARYFEYDDAGGAFTRTAGAGLGGSVGMRARFAGGQTSAGAQDRKSTRLNSSHLVISYAVFCLKKKKKNARLEMY